MKEDNSASGVIQHLRDRIAGEPAGSRLPSVRDLMAALRVGPGTVQQAMAQLASEGVIEAQPGRGTFVAVRPAMSRPPDDFAWQSMALGPGRAASEALGELVAAPSPDKIALTAGYLPPDLEARSPLDAAMGRALRRPGIWGRIPLEGLETLRLWFAREIGNGTRPHDVVICPGGQAAIAGVFRALAAPGSAVLVESPTYIGALTAARAAGLRLVPVPSDAEGVRPEMLKTAFAASGARVFYCQPTYANPSGACLAAERRRVVVEHVAAAGAFLVEDDWARDLALDSTPPAPLAASDRDGHVVYIRSLTKPAAAGLRIAAICGRGAALSRLKSMRTIDDFFVAGPLQEAALQLVTAPSWPRHLRAVAAALRERRTALVAAVHEHFGRDSLALVPGGGFHLWLRLPDEVSDGDVARRAAQAGIIVSAGHHWFPAEPPGSFLRLSFVGAAPDALAASVATLAGIVGRRAG
jgi:DNA-binding transcriptional MocR family regulator